MNEEYVDKIYGSLSEEGWVTVSKDEFKSALSDDAYKQKLYDGLKEEGWLTVNYDEFASSLGGDSMGKPEAEMESTESLDESVSDGGGLTETVGSAESQESPSLQFKPEEEAGSRYEQAGDEFLPLALSNVEKQIEKLNNQISEEKTNIVESPSLTMSDFARPRNPQKIAELEDKLSQRKKVLRDLAKQKEKIDSEFGAQMLGETTEKMADMVEAEESLEGTTTDYLSRGIGNILQAANPSLPPNAAQLKQQAKETLEKDINEEVNNSVKRINSKQQALSEEYNKLGESLDFEMSFQDSLYANGEISEEQYIDNQKQLIDGYTREIAPLEAKRNNLEMYSQDYVNSMNNLAVMANYDDMSAFESGTKSFANEWIRTPRQIAGLMKAMTPVMEALDGTTIPQEAYLAAMSPVTDLLTEITDDNLLKIDQDEEAANMVGSTAAQLSKIIPASIAAPAAGIAVSSAMTFDEMYDYARNTEGLTESEAVDMAGIYMLVAAPLEYLGARTGIQAFGKNQLKREALRIAREGGLTKLTREQGAKQLNAALLKEYGRGITLETLEEGTTEALQSAAMEGVKQLKNTTSGKEIFEFEGGAFVDDLVKSFVYGGIAGGGVQTIGSVGGATASLLGKNSRNVPFEKYKKAILDDNVYQAINKRVAEDKTLSTEEKRNALDALEFDKQTLGMIPDNLSDQKFEQAATILTDKRRLEEKKKRLDKALTGDVDQQIEELDNTLKSIVEPKTKQDENETQGQEELQQQEGQEEVNEEVVQEKEEVTNEETQEEPLLEGVQDGGNQEEVGQESPKLRPEAQEEISPEVEAFAQRIVSGEDVTSPEDQQFYENNKKEVEDALQQIQGKTEEGVLRDERMEETRSQEEIQEQAQEETEVELTEAEKDVNLPPQEPTGTTIRDKANKKVTAIMNSMLPEGKEAEIDPERQALAMSDKEVLEDAKKRVDSGQANPEALVLELAGERAGQGRPRVLSPEEVAELTYYKMQLMNRVELRAEQLESLDPTSGEANLVKEQLRQETKQLENLMRASLLAGTRQAQAFRLRQLTIDEEYSLANQVLRYKVATERDNVPPDIMREFKKIEEKYRQAKKDMKAAEEKIRKQEEELKKLRVPKKVETKKAAKKRKETVEKNIRNFSEKLKEKYKIDLPDGTQQMGFITQDKMIDILTEAAVALSKKGIDIQEAIKTILQEASGYFGLKGAERREVMDGVQRNIFGASGVQNVAIKDGMLVVPDPFIIDLIEQGFDTIETATKKAHEIITKELGIDVDERTVRDAISGYGRVKRLSKEDAKVKLRKLKSFGKLQSQLEDVQQKKRPLRSGAERDKLTQKERELRREINELLKDIPLTQQEQQDQWKSALDSVKQRLRNRIEDLTKQIKAKEKSKPKKGIQYDAEALELKRQADTLKEMLDEIVGKPELTFEQKVNRLEKALQRSIEDYKNRIKREDFRFPETETISTPAIEKLRAQQEKLREEYNRLKNASTEAIKRREAKRIKSLESQIEELIKKINEGDLSTKKRKEISESPQVEELKKQKQQLSEQLNKKKREGKQLTAEEKQYNAVIRQIQNVLDQISGDKPLTSQVKKEDLSERVSDAKDKLANLREKLAETPAAKELAKQKREQSQLDSIERRMQKIQDKIDGKVEIFAKKKAKQDKSEVVKAAEKQLQDLTDTLKETEAYAQALEKKKLESAKKAVRRTIEDYQKRLREGDFEPRKRNKVEPDEELKKARRELQKIRNEWQLEQEKARLRDRGFTEKFIDNLYTWFTLPRTLMASVDFSAPLRQGLILTVGMGLSLDPKKRAAVAQAWGEMFRQAWSKDRYDNWLANIQEDENYAFAKTMGLQLTIPTASIEAREEMFMNRLAGNLFNVKVGAKKYGWGSLIDSTSRAYSAYLNVLRMSAFNDYSDRIRENGYDPSTKEGQKVYEAAAEFINNATGRGDLGKFERADTLLGALFFAPRYVVSRFNILNMMLNPVKWYNTPKPVRQEALKTLAKMIGTGVSVLTLASLAGADVEDDPRSSDFGKIRIGNLRFDVWGGLQQPLRLLLLSIIGETKNPNTGKITVLNTGKPLKGDRSALWINFLRTKLSPSASFVWDTASGNLVSPKYRKPKAFGVELTPWEEAAFLQNVVGQDQTFTERTAAMVSPLFIQDIADIADEEGVGMAFGAFVPALFGAGASYWTPRGVRNTGDFTGVETVLDDLTPEDVDIDYSDLDYDVDVEVGD